MRALLLAVLLALAISTPAAAAVKAKVSIASNRIVVTVTGGKAKAVTVVAGGKTYKLSKSGSKWRSKALANAGALNGAKVKVKVKVGSKTKTLSATIPASKIGGTEPVTGDQPAGQPLFPAPAAPSTGNAAFTAIEGFIANSSFTDCVAGWPNCAVETRYSHFANGAHYYCYLTPTSGSDVKSYGEIERISGAEYNADGSWGIEYYLSSYGNTTFYSWSVSNMGVTTGRYWGPGRDPSSGAPNEQIGPLQWVRGAKDCSY